MKLSFIKNTSLIVISVMLFACGGGGSDNVVTTEVPATQIKALSVMVDGIIAENVDHADHATWNLNNFEVNDDIDGNVDAETAMNAMVDVTVDAMIAADNTNL